MTIVVRADLCLSGKGRPTAYSDTVHCHAVCYIRERSILITHHAISARQQFHPKLHPSLLLTNQDWPFVVHDLPTVRPQQQFLASPEIYSVCNLSHPIRPD